MAVEQHQSVDRADLERRALAAYERGRAAAAVAWASPALLIAALALWLERPLVEVVALGLLAFAFAAWAGWRGEGFQDGVGAGLAIGAVPVVAAVLATKLLGGCGTDACDHNLCALVCSGTTLIGGLVVGGMLADRARSRGRRWMRVTLSSAAIAGALAPLGCLAMTAAGSIGLLIGLAAGAAPVGVRAALAR